MASRPDPLKKAGIGRGGSAMPTKRKSSATSSSKKSKPSFGGTDVSRDRSAGIGRGGSKMPSKTPAKKPTNKGLTGGDKIVNRDRPAKKGISGGDKIVSRERKAGIGRGGSKMPSKKPAAGKKPYTGTDPTKAPKSAKKGAGKSTLRSTEVSRNRKPLKKAGTGRGGTAMPSKKPAASKKNKPYTGTDPTKAPKKGQRVVKKGQAGVVQKGQAGVVKKGQAGVVRSTKRKSSR